MDLFFILVYAGGLVPAYYGARAINYTLLGSMLAAALWPAELGWSLAKHFCTLEGD